MNKYQQQILDRIIDTLSQYESLVVETISNDELDRVIQAIARNMQVIDNQAWNADVPEWAQVRFSQDDLRPVWNKWNMLQSKAWNMVGDRKQQERVNKMLKTIW